MKCNKFAHVTEIERFIVKENKMGKEDLTLEMVFYNYALKVSVGHILRLGVGGYCCCDSAIYRTSNV